MAVGYSNDLTQQYKQNVYHISLDVSGWDTFNFQVVAPVAAALFIYGSLDDGMSQGQLYPSGNYGAELAINWSPIQAIKLSDGTAVSSVSAAGLYSVPVNSRYIRLGGGGADVYRLLQFNAKIG